MVPGRYVWCPTQTFRPRSFFRRQLLVTLSSWNASPRARIAAKKPGQKGRRREIGILIILRNTRFSNKADTGTRVPRNTQAPLTRSRSRSTAGHVDQSMVDISLPLGLFSRRTDRMTGRAVARSGARRGAKSIRMFGVIGLSRSSIQCLTGFRRQVDRNEVGFRIQVVLP